MSEINIRRRHSLTRQEARRLAEDMAGRLSQRFELAYQWDGDALHFQRDGVHGALTVAHGEIHIRARLGFLLSLAKAQIEDEIASSLDEMLDAGGARVAGTRGKGSRPS
jgi:putative polyhydroxyalkanoate system protein